MGQDVKFQRRYVKSEKVFFRISPELKAELKIKLEEAGKSVSEYIRDLIKENLKRG
jgi:predicted HicB family RNase H-like nuclease